VEKGTQGLKCHQATSADGPVRFLLASCSTPGPGLLLGPIATGLTFANYTPIALVMGGNEQQENQGAGGRLGGRCVGAWMGGRAPGGRDGVLTGGAGVRGEFFWGGRQGAPFSSDPTRKFEIATAFLVTNRRPGGGTSDRACPSRPGLSTAARRFLIG
jgi:hypothetical protein